MYQFKNTNQESIFEIYTGLLDELPLACVLLKSDGSIIYCNHAAQRLFECDLCNQSWLDVIQRNIGTVSAHGHFMTLMNRKTISMMTQSLTKINSQLLVFLDVTGIKQEADHANQIANLQSIQQISSVLAHQIKTPLMTASMQLTNLSMIVAEKTGHDQTIEQIVKKLKNQLQQIQHLTETELNLFKASDLNVLKLDLNIILHGLIETYQEAYLNVKFQLNNNKEIKLIVIANQAALISALQNIIDNAVEASHKQGQIDISLVSENGKVYINIIDYGTGIKEQNLAKISKPYFTTKEKGTGLGIPVAKAIIKAHHGELHFSSNNDYTVFTISLPLQTEEK